MKLRAFLILLLLLNLGFWAWSHGWLALWGFDPQTHRSSAYLQEELNPQQLRLITNSTPQHLAQLSNPTVCLSSALLEPSLAQHIETQFKAHLPAGSWQRQELKTAGQWMIYLGRYPNAATLNKKKEELRRLRISNFKDAPPGFQHGIVLAYYDQESQANLGLAQLKKRGVNTAQIITLLEPVDGVHLRIEAADESLREQLLRLRPVLQGQEFSPCP